MRGRPPFLSITMRLLLGAVLIACEPIFCQPASLQAISKGIRDMVDRVAPAVVQISATGLNAASASGSNSRLQATRNGGSGVLVDPNGYIVTNAHVVGTARRVQVSLAPGSTAEPGRFRSILKPATGPMEATIVGVDRETDLAVLKIQATGLPHLAFADSESIRQGDFVFAAGSPFGLENSISMGIVSSVARQVRPDDPVIYIQTDAPVNPGNSGGPLLDAEGRIAGINTAILSQSGGNEGIGLAIPSNIVRSVYQQIREHGRVKRGQIGVVAQSITPSLAKALSLKQDWGVILADVSPGSAAEAAGLEVKDVILTLNGKMMENARQFGVNIYQHAGGTINLELLRGEQKVSKQVAVLERPRDPDRILSLLNGDTNRIPKLGVLVVDLDEKVTPILPGLRRLAGVVVAGAIPGALDREEGLLPGDVIYECNNQRIRTIAELKQAVEAIRAGSAAALHVERQGQLQFLVLDLE